MSKFDNSSNDAWKKLREAQATRNNAHQRTPNPAFNLFNQFDLIENEKFFNFLANIPVHITIIFAFLTILIALIIAILSSSTGTFFVISILGALVCTINYLLLKLLLSFPILHISYLKNIRDNLDAIATNMNDKKE